MEIKFSRHALDKPEDLTSLRLGITKRKIIEVLNKPDFIDNSEYPVLMALGPYNGKIIDWGDMKVKYYPEDDLLVLKLSDRPYEYAEKIGIFIIHRAKDKEPVMLEILKASQFLQETTQALPYSTRNKILHPQTT